MIFFFPIQSRLKFSVQHCELQRVKKKWFYIPNKHEITQLIHNSIVKFMSRIDKILTVNNTQAKKKNV